MSITGSLPACTISCAGCKVRGRSEGLLLALSCACLGSWEGGTLLWQQQWPSQQMGSPSGGRAGAASMQGWGGGLGLEKQRHSMPRRTHLIPSRRAARVRRELGVAAAACERLKGVGGGGLMVERVLTHGHRQNAETSLVGADVHAQSIIGVLHGDKRAHMCISYLAGLQRAAVEPSKHWASGAPGGEGE